MFYVFFLINNIFSLDLKYIFLYMPNLQQSSNVAYITTEIVTSAYIYCSTVQGSVIRERSVRNGFTSLWVYLRNL